MSRKLFIVVFFVLFAAACGDDPKPVSNERPGNNVSTPDAGEGDSSMPTADSGPGNNGATDMGGGSGGDPEPGFAEISGDCQVLDTELTDEQPHLFESALDFGMDPYDESDLMFLTPGGQTILMEGNAGGSSLLSEAFAYEVLARCEDADLLKTETEITYQNPDGKKTDLLVEIDQLKIGVSVTRAVAFPFEDPYTVEQATTLLENKLQQVQETTANVAASDAWEKQILHVIAYSPMHATSIRTAFDAADAALKTDTILWVTATNGDDEFLY